MQCKEGEWMRKSHAWARAFAMLMFYFTSFLVFLFGWKVCIVTLKYNPNENLHIRWNIVIWHLLRIIIFQTTNKKISQHFQLITWKIKCSCKILKLYKNINNENPTNLLQIHTHASKSKQTSSCDCIEKHMECSISFAHIITKCTYFWVRAKGHENNV